MTKYLLSILFISFISFVVSKYTPTPYLIGGSYAKYGQLPYHAQLVDDSMYHNYFCGAGIIGDRWVVTLAQCTIGKTLRKINVVIGEIYLAPHWTLYYAMNNIIHPEYDNVTKANNIAVVKVDERFKFDTYAQPLPIINKEISTQEKLTFSGWGSDTNNEASDVLIFVENFSRLTTERCKEIYEDFTEDSICASHPNFAGACFYDEGSILAIPGEGLIGLFSYGKDLCGSRTPNAFVDLYFHRNWITSVAQ